MKKRWLIKFVLCFLIGCFFLGFADAFPMTAEEAPQVSYEFFNILPGSAHGRISINVSNYNGENYLLHWGTSDKILTDQTPLADASKMEIRGNLLKYTTETMQAIPPKATHLWVTLDGNLLASYEIPQWRLIPSEAPKYRFGVISDLHFGSSQAPSALQAAMDTFSNRDVSFVITSGDNTNGGMGDQWQLFVDTYAPYEEIPLFLTLGNHDALAWNLKVSPDRAMKNLKQAFPNYANESHTYGEEFEVSLSQLYPNYDYTLSYQGDLYVFMGIGAVYNNSEDKNIDQRLSDYQLEWLDRTLEEYYQKSDHGNAFLIFHYYTLESGMSVRSGTEWDRVSSSQLHAVLNKYPGTFYFNGHNHYTFSADFSAYCGKYFSFHVPSLAYGGLRNGKGHENGKEGYLVEVYDDFVLVRGMDFATGNFVSSAAFCASEKLQNYVLTYGVSIKKTASGAVLWNARKGSSDWKELTTLGDLKSDGTIQTFPCSDGKSVEFCANETHVQWRCPQDPDSVWQDFVVIEELPKAPVSDTGSSVVSDGSASSTDVDPSSDSAPWIILALCGGVVCVGAAVVLILVLKKKR